MRKKGWQKVTIKEVSEKYNISQNTLRYYERVGMIPTVHRTPGGIRDYQKEDLGWVELALCMRSAGLPVEVMSQYVKLVQQGDSTIPARLKLLAQQKQIEVTLERLNKKIAKYEEENGIQGANG